MVFPYTLAAAFLLQSPNRLVTLALPDVLIIAIYFVMVLGIGIYLQRYANTSNDFFMAGREMTAWVAGLSFLSANLGAIELMGWAASTYQYGILAAHFYWIAAFPSMVFLGLVMMPFYYLSKTHSVPGYLQLRYGESRARLERNLLRLHDHPDVGHQHVRHGHRHEGGAGLEHPLQHLGLFAHRGRLCRSGRLVFRHLQRGAAVLSHLAGRAHHPHPGHD